MVLILISIKENRKAEKRRQGEWSVLKKIEKQKREGKGSGAY
jgi:hypothetical protein